MGSTAAGVSSKWRLGREFEPPSRRRESVEDHRTCEEEIDLLEAVFRAGYARHIEFVVAPFCPKVHRGGVNFLHS